MKFLMINNLLLIIINIHIYNYCDGAPIQTANYVDLTWGFNNNTLYWPEQVPFSFIKKTEGYKRYKNETYWYTAYNFCAGEHGGTHFDSPYHFNREGWKTGEVPISRLIGPGATVDVSNEVGNNRDFTLESEHLIKWEKENGPIESGTILLLRFGWSSRYHSREDYFGLSPPDEKLHFPGIGQSAAEWIANNKNIVGVGLDTPSIDTGHEIISHRTLYAKNIYAIENVKMLESLPARNFTLIVLPMKISEGTGGPCRIVAALNGN